jgi:hypothetical protein
VPIFMTSLKPVSSVKLLVSSSNQNQKEVILLFLVWFLLFQYIHFFSPSNFLHRWFDLSIIQQRELASGYCHTSGCDVICVRGLFLLFVCLFVF